MKKEKNECVLLLDVGGTFTKIAAAKEKKIFFKKIQKTEEFHIEELKKTIDALKNSNKKVSFIVFACAGPVWEGKCRLANANQSFDEKIIKEIFGVPVKIINDLEAAAYGLRKNKGSLIIGLGTGLGTSIIDGKGQIIPSEEGHSSIERELFISVPELRNTIIPQYEYILGSKKNILGKLLGKKEKEIILGKDRFTEIYLKVLYSFISRLIQSHKDSKIKKIILIGGVSSGNKKILLNFLSELKKKNKLNAELVDDEFAGIKGAFEYYLQKQKSL